MYKNVADRILECSSVTVMARTALQRGIDASFEREPKKRYARELLFSTVINVMGNVVTGAPCLCSCIRTQFSHHLMSQSQNFTKKSRTRIPPWSLP